MSATIPAYRDSGDLIASAHTLGIAHPPGYSLYTVLAKSLSLVPLGNVAYRVNVWSALAGSGAAALCAFGIVLFLQRKSSDQIPWTAYFCAVAAAALYALTPAMTELARVSEMYTTAALFAALIIACLMVNRVEAYRLGWFLFGLGLAAHPIVLFLAPLFFLRPDERPMQRQDYLWSFVALVCGLSIFLFLPTRSAQSPLLNWGNPVTWRNFWRLVTRADYGGLKLHPEQSVLAWTPTSVGTQILYFLKTIRQEWGILGLGLGLCGSVFGFRKPLWRTPVFVLSGSWLIAGPGFFVLSNLPLAEATTPAILQPYLVMSSLLWAFLVAIGLYAMGSRIRWLVLVVAGLAVCESMALIRVSHRADFYAYDYGRDLLHSLPSNAVLFDPDDPTAFTIRALQTTEKRRDDVALLNFFRTRWGYAQIQQRWPELLPGIPIESAQQLEQLFWNYSIKQRPFYVELPQKLGGIPYRNQGLVYAVKPEAGKTIHERGEALMHLYRKRGAFQTTAHADFFTRHLLGYYSAAYNNLGLDDASEGRVDEAITHYKSALCIDPTLAPAYNNWAVIAYNRQDYALAESLYQKAVALDPGNRMLQQNLELIQKLRKN